jgi:hypothetical protein
MPAHSHSERHELHGEGFARARSAKQGHICVFVQLRVEQVDDAQAVIVTVHPKQNAVVVRKLKAGEHIR